MSVIRDQLVDETINKAYSLSVAYGDLDEKFEFRKQTVLAEESLTKDEKLEAIRRLTFQYDNNKVVYNYGTKRTCENCRLECLAASYCEHCIRNYLKSKFSNWTSGNDNIDHLIQKCQIETISPDSVVEWIPYNNLQNIEYLTKGGCSEIYTAKWVGGKYKEWYSKELQLKRGGAFGVILKRLENVENASRNWFDEAKSHLIIGNKWTHIALCFGLTQDPLNKGYMLVMCKYDIDLRKYVRQNHNQLTWKKRIQISYDIIRCIRMIHRENAIHRDLHSGNILYDQYLDEWYISDLGFCGPADKPLKSIYGNLPYVAPEVISGKGYTFASDIYSFAMLMWEISSGKPPFANFKYSDYDLAMNIINGIRPKIMPGTPLEYKRLMQQCWDADPLNRPDAETVFKKMHELLSYYLNKDDSQQTDNSVNLDHWQGNANSGSIDSLASRFSKIHIFEGLPEPRNATEEEQEAYHSKSYDFEIPENIEDVTSKEEQHDFTIIDDGNNEEKNKSKRIYLINSDDEKEDLNNKSKKIKLENNEEIYAYNQVGLQRIYTATNDCEDDESYNKPNLHPEDQDEFEIPEDGF